MSNIYYNLNAFSIPTEVEKLNYKQQIKNLTNEELFEDYTDMAGGDDYDGCWTLHGSVVWEMLEEEFVDRLMSVGFFDDEEE